MDLTHVNEDDLLVMKAFKKVMMKTESKSDFVERNKDTSAATKNKKDFRIQ